MIGRPAAAGGLLPVDDGVAGRFEGVIPKGRGVAIAEVVDAVCFLAKRETGFITGQEISINGGSAMP